MMVFFRSLSYLWIFITLAACSLSSTPAPAELPASTPVPSPTDTPAPTEPGAADLWEIYQNATHGFSFEIPRAYAAGAGKDACGVQENPEGITLGLRSVLVIQDAGGMQPEEFTDRLLQNQSLQVETRTNIIIDRQEGVTVDYRFGGENRFGTFTVVKNAERIFLFGFSSGGFCELPGSQVTEPAAYAHMLETFRFVR